MELHIAQALKNKGMAFPAPTPAYTGDTSAAYFFRKTGTKLRGHAGRGYRAPSLYERFGTGFDPVFGYSVYGDPLLKPEHSTGLDGGVDQTFFSGRLKTSASYFYTLASGLEALLILRRAAERGTPFSLVVTDCHMPDMDGFDLAARIRNSPYSTDAVVMMLTSGEQQEDILRCGALGVAAYLTKPVRRAELRAAMATALRGRFKAGDETPVKTPVSRCSPLGLRAGAKVRILLTEDNVVNQRVALRILEKEDEQGDQSGAKEKTNELCEDQNVV